MQERLNAKKKKLPNDDDLQADSCQTQSKKVLKEINLFSPPEGHSCPAANCSPKKTNPFESCDRPVRLAKLNPETPMFGPALPKKVSRVLSGEEREKFEKSLKDRKEQKSLRQLSQVSYHTKTFVNVLSNI